MTEWRQELLAFVGRRVPEADAEDLVQEILARLVDKGTTSVDSERVGAWLFRVARNVVTDYYRRRGVRAGTQAADFGGDAESLLFESPLGLQSTEVEQAEAALQVDSIRLQIGACLRPFLDRLSPEFREALILVELQGLTQGEAASQLGLSVSGMKSRVQRARARLFSELSRCCAFEQDSRQRVMAYEVRDNALLPKNATSSCSVCDAPSGSTASPAASRPCCPS